MMLKQHANMPIDEEGAWLLCTADECHVGED